MGNKIKAAIVDKTTLRLEEDATKGDYILLSELDGVDTSIIIEKIKAKQDEVYNLFLKEKLSEEEKRVRLEEENKRIKEINDLNGKIHDLENVYEVQKNIIKDDYNSKLSEKDKIINELNTNIASLNERTTSLKKEVSLEKESEYNDKIRKIEKQKDEEILSLKEKLSEKEFILSTQKESFEKEKSIISLEAEKVYSEKIRTLEYEISQLKLEKSQKNVKKLGEELEIWCKREYENYSINGFEDCTFEKDNTAVKDDGEKGTKADYIFKVYSSNSSDKVLLTSVCLEMKNESPNSQNKKKNSDHYKKLDQDRNKKNLEYALLVSELEWESDNDAPIKKVNEYDKMYVVRPTYFITFLSIIASLGKKYKDIIASSKKEEQVFKDRQTIIEEFDAMKKECFEKPIEELTKHVSAIETAALNIVKQAENISNIVFKITDGVINKMKNKIDGYNIERKIIKKIGKIEGN